MIRPSKFARQREQTGSPAADRMQRVPLAIARGANLNPFFQGRLVKNITFAAGVDKVIDHALGRRPQGVFIVRDYGANVCTGVGESTTQPSSVDLTKQISLRSPVACTVDVWVF